MIYRPWIKVCGLTRWEDASAAVRAGASAVGFVFVAGSPREIRPDAARSIGARLPAGVARVGVVAGDGIDAVRRLVEEAHLTAIQAHGDESPEDCLRYGVPVVKAVRLGAGFLPSRLEPFRSMPILLDAYAPGALGGTGRLVDWTAARAAREAGFRVLLAGGLGPENLLDAVTAVLPVAVDLNSGVERSPGLKDTARIQEAIARLDALEPPEEGTWPW